MRPWGPLWLGALCLVCPHTRSFGLDPSRHISQYGHTVWRAQDGEVSATSPIAQTTDGYIWIGTPNGLSRFDGVRFVPWASPADSGFILRHVTALLGASDGSLWIGTSAGLGRLKDGHFRSYSKPGDRWGIFSIIEDTICMGRRGRSARFRIKRFTATARPKAFRSLSALGLPKIPMEIFGLARTSFAAGVLDRPAQRISTTWLITRPQLWLQPGLPG
jgi:ligand-binding sensor domain-containing protein